MSHTINVPQKPKSCPRCGKFDVSIRIFQHKVFCNNCKSPDGSPLDITAEVATFENKHEIGGQPGS